MHFSNCCYVLFTLHFVCGQQQRSQELFLMTNCADFDDVLCDLFFILIPAIGSTATGAPRSREFFRGGVSEATNSLFRAPPRIRT